MESRGYRPGTRGNSVRSPAGTRSRAPATTAGSGFFNYHGHLTPQMPWTLASAASKWFDRGRGRYRAHSVCLLREALQTLALFTVTGGRLMQRSSADRFLLNNAWHRSVVTLWILGLLPCVCVKYFCTRLLFSVIRLLSKLIIYSAKPVEIHPLGYSCP